jgi:signal transduction histidine kinase
MRDSRGATVGWATVSVDITSSGEQIKERARNLQTQIVQMSEDVRKIAHQLYPSILEDLGLNTAYVS